MSESTGRNSNDLIMELVQLHIKQAHLEGTPVQAEQLEEIFLKYYELIDNPVKKLREIKN